MPATRPLRIAMVVASPFPANHGTPGSIREQAEAIAALGHEVHLVTYHLGAGFRPPPGPLHYHRTTPILAGDPVVGPTWKKPLLDVLLAWKLVRVVWREGIDIIHGHNYEGALVGFVGRLLTGRPLVYSAINTMQDELPSYGFLRPQLLARALARLLDATVPRLASHVTAISDELGAFLLGKGLDPRRVEVIPLGVEASRLQHLDPTPVRRRLGAATPIVLYTGVLSSFQRLDYLIAAMQVVVTERPDAQLVLAVNCARESEVAAFLAEAREAGLGEHVRVEPVRTFEDVGPYLAAADVAVVPRPHCPGFPVKLLNYMAAGTPIVVFEGSAKGLEHRRTAWLAADHDPAALARGILAVLGDPALGRRLGDNARQRALEVFDWPALAARTVASYRRLLGDRA